ncbi:C25 family cysteine peptidase [Polyangium aurulentum]|uniref:C25 family cysteine peptidase n=1 Tax=Polyangium aurulentum TaxID=2567896 RepID=UPI00146EFE29|nr:C25 family cysteine peptidase [Polyangium aurulentum]UQA62227.1 hypothetical protein E8A73_017855 [Polyangium aurulentum]
MRGSRGIRRALRGLAMTGLALAAMSCGRGAAEMPAASAPAVPAEWAEWVVTRADVDYVAVGKREMLAAAEPLFAHRAARGHVIERLALEDVLARKPAGASDAEAIAAAIRSVAAQVGTRLKFVLLLGDTPGRSRGGPETLAQVPAFYARKIDYQHDRPDEHGLEGSYGARWFDPQYPTDLPYALAHRDAPGQPELSAVRFPRPLAVGRVPAWSPDEVAAFAQKIIAYETTPTEGAWRKSITLFSGPANFGALTDFLIERTATRSLDKEVPYDWDVDVVFPKLDSPYAYPFPELRQHMRDRLTEGALIAAYVGHGAPARFDDVRFRQRDYNIGSSSDLEGLRIDDGKPFFVSITCSTGHYDLSGMRSIAETLVMNPGGAIASFASSRESHPYTNALLGKAILEVFVQARARTVGEGIVEVKRRMMEGSIPLAPLLFASDPKELAVEHEGLYNLFGDPATELRYPAKATLSVKGSPAEVRPGAVLEVTLESKEIDTGNATLTVETRRSVIRGKLVSPSELENLRESDTWKAMRKNYQAAMNKVVTQAKGPISGGRAVFKVKAPVEPGEYAIKGFAAGGGEAATSVVQVRVREKGAGR